MNIDGIFYNQEWAKKKTESEFVKEFIDTEHIYPDADKKEKEKLLKAAYKELTGEPAAEKKSEPNATPAGK